MKLTLHHVGCLVENIPAALATYAGTYPLADIPAPVAVRSQKVSVCFLPLGNGTFIEFVEPESDNVILLKMLRRGISYYHVAYMCADLDQSIHNFLAAGAHQLDKFQSEAFAGRECVFLKTAELQLIELIAAS